MAVCLTERTRLGKSIHDSASFLLAVDRADADGASASEYRFWSVAYADCGRDYFDELAAELGSRRSSEIESNKIVIRDFARQLVAAGYVA